MAKFRNVSVKFWSDPFIESLTPEKKYFFLYLITNEHSSQCGIYEISYKQMAFETGYNQETVQKLVQFFEKSGKIKYSKRTNELAIKNFVKHNPQGSPKVAAFVEKELKMVKDRVLIAYIYDTDTLSQEEQEEEQTKEEEKKEKPQSAIILPFDSDIFKNTWGDWERHRKEKRNKLTPSAIKKQLNFLGGRPENEAIEIMNRSITNGWTGLFPLSKQINGIETIKVDQRERMKNL